MSAITVPLSSGETMALRRPSARAWKDDPKEGKLFWFLLRQHASRHSGALILAVTLNAIPGVGVAIQTLAPKYLIDSVLEPAQLSVSSRIVRLCALLLIYLASAFVLRMGAWYASYKLWTRLREQVTMDLRAQFFQHINRLCLRFHGRHTSGELFSYVMGTPLGEISSFCHNLVMNVPNALTAFVCSVCMIGLWDWSLTIVLLVLVVSTVLAMKDGSGRLERLHEDYQRIETRIIGRLTDIFRGNRDVKMYAIEDRIDAAFRDNANVLRQKACDRDLRMHKVNMRQEAIGYCCFALVCALGAWRNWEHRLTLGELVAYLAAYSVLQGPVSLMFGLGTQWARVSVSSRRLEELLSATTSTPEPKGRTKQNPADRADICLRDVEFSYLPNQPVLLDINLTIPFGQRIAFVGPSGAGKSTLAKLLLRLYDVDRGSISLGPVNLRDCSPRVIRQKFGVVPQDPYFFATTIRENLLVMKANARDCELRAVCELANAWEFIERMPEGFDTLIGEGGARLSGGQRQRLAIARALLHKPFYMIFDEATSALDTISERLVQNALARILSGGQRTAVFIAHRLSTIKNCDRVLVLDCGRIIQDGTFEDLRAIPGMFRDMVESDRF